MHSVRRLEGDSALRIHTYRGLRLMSSEGPFVLRGLSVLRRSLLLALATNPHVFVLRIDLAVPAGELLPEVSTMLTVVRECFLSRQASLRRGRQSVHGDLGITHNPTIRYFWRRDASGQVRPVYSLALFLNRDAFFTALHYRSERDNAFVDGLRVVWAQTLGLSAQAVLPLVKAPVYSAPQVRRGQAMRLSGVFYALSPLCQGAAQDGAETPTFGFGRV